MKVVLSSPFFLEQPSVLKLGALYCDQIILSDWGLQVFVPLDDPPYRTFCSTTPHASSDLLKELELLADEKILVLESERREGELKHYHDHFSQLMNELYSRDSIRKEKRKA